MRTSVREGNSGTEGGCIRAKAGGSFVVVRTRMRDGPAGSLLGWLRHAGPHPGLGRTWAAGPFGWPPAFSGSKAFRNFISKINLSNQYEILY
jgi:hypothetical protein